MRVAVFAHRNTQALRSRHLQTRYAGVAHGHNEKTKQEEDELDLLDTSDSGSKDKTKYPLVFNGDENYVDDYLLYDEEWHNGDFDVSQQGIINK